MAYVCAIYRFLGTFISNSQPKPNISRSTTQNLSLSLSLLSMASFLDSVTVTRVFSLPITSSISPASKVPSVSARRISPVPEFRGLKASRKSSVTQSASLGTNLGSRFARGGRIVCEAQDTTAAAVEGIQLTF